MDGQGHRLDAAPEREVTIPITATGNRTERRADSDYSGVPASVVFGAADTSKSFSFTAAARTTWTTTARASQLAFGTLPDAA